MDTRDIYHLLADHFDIIYFSARKLGFAKELTDYGVPVILPAGGLGCHLDAGAFCPPLLLRSPEGDRLLAGRTRREVPQRLRRQPVIYIDYGSD